MRDMRRITLIDRSRTTAPRSWDASSTAANRIIFVDSFSILCGALHHAAHDVDRLILDRAATEGQFLELLTTLPSSFVGDVLFISNEEHAFLSTTGRAGGRLLYAVTPADVEFYLETQRLVTKVAAAA